MLYLKRGETLTYGTRESLTYGIGKSLTSFEVKKGGFSRCSFLSSFDGWQMVEIGLNGLGFVCFLLPFAKQNEDEMAGKDAFSCSLLLFLAFC